MPDARGRWKRWIITMGGAGFLPAPGTWGSLVASIILYVLLRIAGPQPIAQCTIELAALALFCLLAIALGDWGIKYFGRDDPGGFVLDEAAGISLSMLLLPAVAGRMLIWTTLAAFLAFRLFDITKPPPARQLERLHGGWGILLDDLAAAIYANILCQLLFRWIIPALHGGA